MFKEGIMLCLLLVGMGMAACGPTPMPVSPADTLTRVSSERLISKIESSWILESLTVSPDSKRVAYVAGVDNKHFVVVNGKEEKLYDGIGAGSLTFSPDSQQLAYGARLGDKWFVVVDGKEEKPYDGIVTVGGGRIIFDSADSLHYLAGKGADIYLVEERIQ